MSSSVLVHRKMLYASPNDAQQVSLNSHVAVRMSKGGGYGTGLKRTKCKPITNDLWFCRQLSGGTLVESMAPFEANIGSP